MSSSKSINSKEEDVHCAIHTLLSRRPLLDEYVFEETLLEAECQSLGYQHHTLNLYPHFHNQLSAPYQYNSAVHACASFDHPVCLDW
jgi:hypothetical protein